MDELFGITDKYTPAYVEGALGSLDSLDRFALGFYKDVAEIYETLTRVKNIERNQSGFSIEDAPILGLLVRIARLLREVIRNYEAGNAEVISILERPLIEAATIASYLMRSDADVMLDYRKCSYKGRLRILRDFDNGSRFFDTKPGQRLYRSVQEKLAIEGFAASDFDVQRKNRWRLQGKSFFDIFAEIEEADLYASTYGMMSETIHGSWNESLDWCLTRQDDGTYKANPFSYPTDIRFVSPTLQFTNKAYRAWTQRVEIHDENVEGLLDWIERVNGHLFRRFDQLFDE